MMETGYWVRRQAEAIGSMLEVRSDLIKHVHIMKLGSHEEVAIDVWDCEYLAAHNCILFWLDELSTIRKRNDGTLSRSRSERWADRYQAVLPVDKYNSYAGDPLPQCRFCLYYAGNVRHGYCRHPVCGWRYDERIVEGGQCCRLWRENLDPDCL